MSGFLAGSRLGEFLTNCHDQLKTNDFLLYASGLIAGIYISSDGTCRLSSWSVLFSLVSPAPNAK